ncbi:MAG: hypothetical protein ACEPOV_05960 [Hyphomicrobiales bacterium]
MLTLQQLILDYAHIPVFFALLFSIIRIPRLSKGARFLFLYLLITSIIELLAGFLNNKGQSNLPLLHVYVPLEFFTLGMLYLYYLKGSIKSRYIAILIIGFITYSIINSIFFSDLYSFNNIARGIENILLLLLTLIYYAKVLFEMKIKKLEKEPMIWINTGILFYFASNLFVFIFSNVALSYSEQLNLAIWTFHAVFNWILYILISIGLLLLPQKVKAKL